MRTRCDLEDSLVAAGCRTVTAVREANLRITQAEPLSPSRFFTPQRVTADLFKNHPVTFTVRVMIPDNFRKNRVTLRTKNKPSNLAISITSPCPGSIGSGPRLSCPVRGSGDEMEFQVQLTLTGCGDDSNTRMRLKASGIRGNVRIDVLNRCTCACEFYSVFASSEPAEYCSDNGEVLCGLCHCYPGYNGDRCQCQKSQYEQRCVAEGSSDVCSGQGECVCGYCHCNKVPEPTLGGVVRYSGRYCECDDTACPVTDLGICGGVDHGRCVCSQCVCKDGFTGAACEIATDSDPCLSSDGSLCANHGMCIGGQCECDGVWMGPTCEDCPTCASRCHSLKSCVQCTAFRTGPLNEEECRAQCTALGITLVDNIDETNVGNTLCASQDDDDTIMRYAYIYIHDGSMVVLVNRVKELLV
ncbi:integrin beta-5-like isoform X2 [Liolophura sinensis]